MANIPVEKKSGFPWWLLLLGLLLLALLAFFLWPDDEEVYEVEDEVVAVDPVEPIETTGVITSWSELQNVADRQNLVGRRINIDNLIATRISGDSTFFVGDRTTPESERLFVVLRNLGESETGAMGRDGRYNVDRMEEMRLMGTIERLGPNDPDAWMLDETDANMVRNGNVFVAASNLAFEDDTSALQDPQGLYTDDTVNMNDMDMDGDTDMDM
jgi:hypothetical protein